HDAGSVDAVVRTVSLVPVRVLVDEVPAERRAVRRTRACQSTTLARGRTPTAESGVENTPALLVVLVHHGLSLLLGQTAIGEGHVLSGLGHARVTCGIRVRTVRTIVRSLGLIEDHVGPILGRLPGRPRRHTHQN